VILMSSSRRDFLRSLGMRRRGRFCALAFGHLERLPAEPARTGQGDGFILLTAMRMLYSFRKYDEVTERIDLLIRCSRFGLVETASGSHLTLPAKLKAEFARRRAILPELPAYVARSCSRAARSCSG
jgi:hypothetical protein